MFNKRKSRPNGPMLPPTDPGNVSKNALAAASAIGQAIKTGTPIPRSNSFQRTSSLQRNSFSKVPSRSSSLLGLQGPPAHFQESKTQNQPSSRPQSSAPYRSQSLTTGSRQSKPTFTRPSPSSQPGKPRMIKKHVPGPYGLITIEVPAEEPVAPARKPTQRRTNSLVKPPRITHSDTRSRSSSNASSKRPIFADELPDVKEDAPLEFEHQEPQHILPAVATKNNLTFIEEEETEEEATSPKTSSLDDAEKVEGIDELEKLKLEKEADEEKIVDTLEKDQLKQQDILSEQSELIAPAVTADSDRPSSDYENDVLDHYTDLPSTAKSTDTLGAGQSSITTADSDFGKDYANEPASNMAQHLRPTIPALYVNNNKEPTDTSPQSISNDVNSSIYSENSIEEVEVPSRSEKRDHASPRKSALKYKTSSGSNLNLSDSNPASQAYLSLATAENTRLNAMSSSNHSSTSLSRSASARVVDKPLNRASNSGAPPPRSQLRQGNKVPQPQLREGNRVPPRPQSAMDIPSRQGSTIKRPQSVQGMRPPQQPQQQHQPQYQRPQSAQGFRQAQPPQSQQHQKQQQQHQSKNQQKTPIPTRGGIPKSASNAAAVNAVLKKNEPPRPKLEKQSSFEKDRPQDQHSAFKRKSLRDPAINGNHTVESNLGFYRHQAQQQGKVQQPQQVQPPANNFNQALEGFTNFKSRFNDSDSDIDVPITNDGGSSNHNTFVPPPNNPALRKPKSSYTLRSSSVSAVPGNPSPAKSLPEKRATRYFSESGKEQLFNEHLEKSKVIAEDGGKKKSTFGKLKKLFGRSSKE